ncbi:hypothetical protein M770_34370 (plasmid) [Pseudomonas aeruginosa VRFPA03]|nr:hypothetical protein M770_34370 [Pseudomonas aeruginosa VRFPA03]
MKYSEWLSWIIPAAAMASSRGRCRRIPRRSGRRLAPGSGESGRRRHGDEAAAQLALLRQFVERRREALADLEVQLATLPTEPAQHAESLP